MILYDDGYQGVMENAVETGDLALYYEGSDVQHVGIVVRIDYDRSLKRSVTVLSQWGAAGEYIHPVNHVPAAYGKRVEYCTERRPVP